jgi:hypothetical protein
MRVRYEWYDYDGHGDDDDDDDGGDDSDDNNSVRRENVRSYNNMIILGYTDRYVRTRVCIYRV